MGKKYKTRNKFREATGRELIESWLRIYKEILEPTGISLSLLIKQHSQLFQKYSGANDRIKQAVSKAQGLPVNELKKLIARCERHVLLVR